MAVKFGQKFDLVVSHNLVDWLSEELKDWVTTLSQSETEIDLDWYCILSAQSLITKLAEKSMEPQGDRCDSSTDQTPVDGDLY